MASTFKSSSSSRFVIEDSIPKVTSDGEPHEVMTIVAMLSGSIAAAIVLFILFSLIGNRRGSNDTETSDSNTTSKDECTSPSTIIPMFTASHTTDESDKSRPQLLSVSTISELLSETSNTGMLNYGYAEYDLTRDSSKVVRFSGISTVKC